MATNARQVRTAQAVQACVMCKTRKKKCNKYLPSCGYCCRKSLNCVYARVSWQQSHAENPHARGSRLPTNIISSRMIFSMESPADQIIDETHQGQVYLEVHRVIRATGQFVDDIIARYFQGFHRHLPIISRIRFSNSVIDLGAAPTADISVLLLTICLITYAPALGRASGNGQIQSVEQQSLYLTARSILTQVQVSCSSSVPLIQAALLLAVYEYTHGRPGDAFVTIAGSARLAYAARIHAPDRSQTQDKHTACLNVNTALRIQAEEAANTWWGIVIYERLGPTAIDYFPRGDSRLPIEGQVLDQLDILDSQPLPNIPASCLTSPKVGGFSRAAQATYLLDQVLKGFENLDIDAKLLQLDRLDTDIQAFLSLILSQCQPELGAFCPAINIAIRALFMLHWHIINQQPQTVTASFKSLEWWKEKSREALDTVTKMVINTAESLITASPANTATQMIDAMPPMYPYTARAALRHIHESYQRGDVSWLRKTEEKLQTSLDKYFQRWSVSDNWIRAKGAI